MFDETTETTEETTESSCITVKNVATCMVLGASTYVIASKALLYYRLRKARKAYEADQAAQAVENKAGIPAK